MAPFIPRPSFPSLSTLTIPRSYYLGHHASGLAKMQSILSTVDLIIECRDYRTPLSSRNPLFESALSSRPRLIVYTKRDLGTNTPNSAHEQTIAKWFAPNPVLFTSTHTSTTINTLLTSIRNLTDNTTSTTTTSHLFGTRALIIGMPNVGKSTLLNKLRNVSLHLPRAARVGDQPGITRKIGTAVKIIDQPSLPSEAGNVYVLDTPGVFVPYIADAETMLKLAACGNVKEGLVPMETVADYLLYRINKAEGVGPEVYGSWSEPTNEVAEVLERLARSRGRLKRGGGVDVEAAAGEFVRYWRAGRLGRFVLDDVHEGALRDRDQTVEKRGGSWNQARRVVKEARKLKMS